MARRKRHENSPQGEDISEVCVTPLADVSLTLVIMMMVIAPMVFQSMIQVKAAQAVATRTEQRVKEKPLFVDITKKGFAVNTRTFSTEYDLFRFLQRNLARKRDRTVLITSAANVRYETVIRVLDLVKQSGASNLSLVPRKGKNS